MTANTETRKCQNCQGEGKRHYPQRGGVVQTMDCTICEGSGRVAMDPEYRVLRDRDGRLISRTLVQV
jgi:DnaJ-class molecular chaperone